MEEADTDAAPEGRPSGVSGDSAESATDDLREAVVEAIRTLPTQSKLVLLAVLARDRRGATPSSTGEVYNTYERLCGDAPVDPLSQRRVTDLLDELDTFGLVSAAVVSEGRYGRTREIKSSVALGPTREVLLADGRLEAIAGESRDSED